MRKEAYHDVLEERRRIAVRMLERDMDPKLIARLVDTHPQTLRAKPHPGPACRLDDAQKREYLSLLAKPPSEYGYGEGQWTTWLMARLIRDRFDVEYHHNHVGVMMHELGYSWQMPDTQARERDEERIRRWREEDWPRIVSESDERRSTVVFVDEAGFSMIPTLKKRWARRGQTPVVKHRHRWHRKVSVIGGLSVSPDRTQAGLTLEWYPGENVDGERVVKYLEGLCQEYEGAVDVVWDNLWAHRGKGVREFLERQPRACLHHLPPYAPELNPIEGVWSLTKYHRMANHEIDDLERLHARALAETADVAAQPDLLRSCVRHAGLGGALWPSGDQ